MTVITISEPTKVQSGFVYPDPVLPAWALELAWQAVDLHKGRKHCMLTVRFDGLAWQIYESHPSRKGQAIR